MSTPFTVRKSSSTTLGVAGRCRTPTPTGHLDLHDVALGIGLTVNHSPYDTLYVAFAVAMGARGVVVADGPFVANMARHPDPALAAMLIPLAE